jgi:shikimate kinase
MRGEAIAYGAGTIVNAIATWRGAAFGIELRTKVSVELRESDAMKIEGYAYGGQETCDSSLIVRCAELVLERYGLCCEGKIRSESEIPIGKGLKSSSAAANAAVLATLRAINEEVEPLEVVKLGVQGAKDVGVTITGAFDDACASLLGGVVITDNKNLKLIKRDVLDSDVLIFVPEEVCFTKDVDVEACRLMAPFVEEAYRIALEGRYERAMTINGLIYCTALGYRTDVLMGALKYGARGCTLSGTGPSFIAILGDGANTEKICEKWKEIGGNFIHTKINNKGVIT